MVSSVNPNEMYYYTTAQTPQVATVAAEETSLFEEVGMDLALTAPVSGLNLGRELLTYGEVAEDFSKTGKFATAWSKISNGAKNLTSIADDVYKANNLAKNTKLSFKNLWSNRGIYREMADGVLDARSAMKTAGKATKKTGFLKKLFGGSTSTATSAATSAANSTAKTATKGLKGALKKSGAGLMLAIQGVTELFTEVVPAFKNGGAKEGFKQLCKSLVNVGVSTASFIIGDKIGEAIGATLGSALGPVGTLIGGWVGGLIGGTIVNYVTSKITKKFVGESYSEKVANQEATQTATQTAYTNDATATTMPATTTSTASYTANMNNQFMAMSGLYDVYGMPKNLSFQA